MNRFSSYGSMPVAADFSGLKFGFVFAFLYLCSRMTEWRYDDMTALQHSGMTVLRHYDKKTSYGDFSLQLLLVGHLGAG
ncbi:MAG: hypothetical protein IJU11_01250 [Prevotella sp.]|nr:hypothetical protein [Prevotella sp.]